MIALTSPTAATTRSFPALRALNIQAVARIPGVGFVRLFGARDYSMRIWLDPDKMARLGVTAGDVVRIVQEQNVVAPAGRIGVAPVPEGLQMQYSVTVQGRLVDVSQYENIVVSAATNGRSCAERRRAIEPAARLSTTCRARPARVFVGIFCADPTARSPRNGPKRCALAAVFPTACLFGAVYEHAVRHRIEKRV